MPSSPQLVDRPNEEALLLATAKWCERMLALNAEPSRLGQ
jgi:hypothetical protein